MLINNFFLNRKGDEKLFFLFLMGVVFVLAIVLVSAIVSFLRLDTDIRVFQANLIADKISNCVQGNPSIVFLEESELLKEFSSCGVVEEIFKIPDDFCIIIFNGEESLFRSCPRVFETTCRVTLNKGMFAVRKSAGCYETSVFSLNENLNKVKVLVGIYPKGGKL